MLPRIGFEPDHTQRKRMAVQGFEGYDRLLTWRLGKTLDLNSINRI